MLFPALSRIVLAAQMRELGQRFEQEGNWLFSNEGFEKRLDQLGTIEKQLGINDLDQFPQKARRQ